MKFSNSLVNSKKTTEPAGQPEFEHSVSKSVTLDVMGKMKLLSAILILVFLNSCSSYKTIEVYELTEPLAYILDVGDGTGYVRNIRENDSLILPEGTQIKVITRKGFSFATGSAYYHDIKIINGKFKGNEIYLNFIDDNSDSMKLIKGKP